MDFPTLKMSDLRDVAIIIGGLSALFAAIFAYRAFRQTQKVFGFENRVIPSIHPNFEDKQNFQFEIANNGKSPMRNVFGYYKIIHYENQVDPSICDEHDFYKGLIESGDRVYLKTDFKYSEYNRIKTGTLYAFIIMTSPDFRSEWIPERKYMKILFQEPGIESGFSETDEKLYGLNPKHHSLVLQRINEIKKKLAP